jgi:hypothetical protein
MAKFGRDFVRAATQPAYLEGLFTATQGLGGMPRRRREEKEQQALAQGLFGFEQAVREGKISPELYSTMSSAYGGMITPQNEEYVRGRLTAIESEQQGRVNRKAAADLARLSGEVSNLELENISPAEKNKQLDEIRTQMDQLISTTTLNPSVIASIIPDAQQSALRIKAMRGQQKLLDDKLENLGFEEEKRNYTRQMWQQNTESGQLAIDIKNLDLAAKQAREIQQLAGTLPKEVFLKRYPGKEAIYEDVAREREADKLRLEQLKASVDGAKFNFDKDTLISLGLNEEEADALMITAGTNPSFAKTTLKNMLTNKSKNKKPSAALAGMFEDVALGHILQVEDERAGGSWEEKYGKTSANALALKAADIYINSGEDIEAALAFIYSYEKRGKKKGSPFTLDSSATTPTTETDYASEIARRDAAGK